MKNQQNLVQDYSQKNSPLRKIFEYSNRSFSDPLFIISMTSQLPLPQYPNFTQASISPEGLSKLLQLSKQAKYPGQHTIWTDDYRVELPIRIGKEGVAAVPPITIIEEWKTSLLKFGKLPALSVKRGGKWVTLTFEEYYGQCLNFARVLLNLKYPEFTVVNLIGFNSPEWVIAYMGTIFARCIPVGIYATNSMTACHYIAEHSEARLVVAENNEYAEKYLPLLGKNIDRIVLYGEKPKNTHNGRVTTWQQFISLGKDTKNESELQLRMGRMQPGNCATLIYTSGTTGMPKGVMLSHDNFLFSVKSSNSLNKISQQSMRIISYLPLSHAAGQFIDIFVALVSGHHVYFADPSALTGSLIDTLLQVRPNAFFSVPRVWQKIYEKMMEVSRSNTGVLAKIATWAKSIGQQGTIQQQKGEQTSFQFKMAKKLVYNKVKAALGLDQCNIFVFGSAPLDPAIRKYFFSLNMFLRNGYGMTECTAPECSTDPQLLTTEKKEDYLQVGTAVPGTEMKIYKLSQKDQEGEICMRGRNICMGYFKNPEDTAKTIDVEGFLHSGDLGRIKEKRLFITGRVKELIITAGGENIPPILIENQIKQALPCLSNAMAIGDHRKYLTCLISLKEDPPLSGNLEKTAIQFLSSRGCHIKTVKQAINNPAFRKIVQQGLAAANTKAISRAQHVQDFHLMAQDFTIEAGTLTPTLKVRRKEVMKKYETEIQAMYTKPKL